MAGVKVLGPLTDLSIVAVFVEIWPYGKFHVGGLIAGSIGADTAFL
jgi:hypothetical protein